jgi:hypothetical protein
MTDLPAFDPNAEFVAALPIRYRGKALTTGAPIDKTLAGDTDQARERVLKILYENRRISVAPAEAAGQTEDEKAAGIPALTDAQQARVAELEKDHSRDELNELAAGAPFNIAEPGKFPTKGAVATAIVRAEAAAA